MPTTPGLPTPALLNWLRAACTCEGESRCIHCQLASQLSLLQCERDAMQAALSELHVAAKRVSNLGAETGPQWIPLTVALTRARALLAGEA